jgi:hypothetical protein
MKILKSPQKVLILFLSVLIVISFIMIVRLEGKAANLQSRLDEHHKSLKQNEDVLSNLKVFQRMVQVNGIYLDDKIVGFFTGKSRLDMTDDKVILSSDGDIEIGPNTNKSLGYSKNKDFIYMYHNGSRIYLGQIGFKSGKEQGIRLISKDDGSILSVANNGIVLTVLDKQGDYKISMAPSKDYLKISKDESVIKLEKENIDIEAKGDIKIGPSDEKNFGYNKSVDKIYMLNQDSRVIVGPLERDGKFLSNGIMLIAKTDGPQLAVYDKMISLGVPGKDLTLQLNLDKEMIGMKQGQSTIKLEKNKLEIEVVGDINITSKNGNVNINGKKVNLNE